MAKKNLRKIKKILANTSLHAPLLEIEAFITRIRIGLTNAKQVNTIYILSPYKTGTTYFATLWDKKTTKHEPCHLCSLKYLGNNFESRFFKRANYLSLKMECSGFLSMYLDQLPAKKSQEYIYILRTPSKWVASVLAHFDSIKHIGYDYIDRFFWSKFLGYSMASVLKQRNEYELQKLVSDLYDTYFKLLNSAIKNQDILFVKLENLDNLAKSLDIKMSESPNFKRSWKRKSKIVFNHVETFLEHRDKEYEDIIRKISVDRFVGTE